MLNVFSDLKSEPGSGPNVRSLFIAFVYVRLVGFQMAILNKHTNGLFLHQKLYCQFRDAPILSSCTCTCKNTPDTKDSRDVTDRIYCAQRNRRQHKKAMFVFIIILTIVTMPFESYWILKFV